MKYLLLFVSLILSCNNLKKDNKPQDPIGISIDDVKAMRAIYREGVKANLDSYGLWESDSNGDSAVFSCLARVGGGADFNPRILLSAAGQLGRHASLWDDREAWKADHCDYPPKDKKSSCTPVSKDMMNGFLWCLVDYGDEDKPAALDLTKLLISFGKDHPVSEGPTGWMMCTSEDRKEFNITDKDWLSRCLMPPAVVKDIYRVAKWLGYDCDSDQDCKAYMLIGANLANSAKGYQRHLSNNTQVRNGLVDGALNDNSVKLLKKYADAESGNPIYLASHAMFTDGDQSRAIKALERFPKDRLPNSSDYCSHWVLQRDERRFEDLVADSDGCIKYNHPDSTDEMSECNLEAGKKYKTWVYNSDHLPCPDRHKDGKGYGADVLYAIALILGDVPNVEGLELKSSAK